ncbi:hypothetical protein T05_5329 [Trichinella murrelli]|uniref:Uncharacterized protein n=1 Tax=Trichinella murrelli TaxID=144512 RepID=A0A0V0UEB5_9BILA|nr:hypothetical protein T05_5329 [Trichinella murrelli]
MVLHHWRLPRRRDVLFVLVLGRQLLSDNVDLVVLFSHHPWERLFSSSGVVASNRWSCAVGLVAVVVSLFTLTEGAIPSYPWYSCTIHPSSIVSVDAAHQRVGALPCKELPECLHKSLRCYSCNESQSISGSLARGSEVQRSPHRYWNIDRVLGDPVES